MLFSICITLLALSTFIYPANATPYTETVPNGNGAIPNTYPPVGGTVFVLIGQNGNIYYQFVNPSTQFVGFQNTGTPVAFQGNPFQLGPTQALNCGPTACSTYFGGSIVEGYVRLTARDGDSCPGNFDFNDLTFQINGINVTNFSGLPAGSVERTNFAGTTSIGFENCFRNQAATETSTGWFNITAVPGLLNNILTTGSTTPTIFDNDPNDNRWFFTDGNDATGTPEVAPGVDITKSADVSSYSIPGDIINYSFVVENIGSVTLNSVAVTDPAISGPITCPQTTLVSTASMTCTASYTITQADVDAAAVFVNTATVTAVPTEGTLGDVSGEVTITGPAANNVATVAKSADVTTDLQVGNTVTYTYTVANTGNITFDNVTISDAHNGLGSLSGISGEVLTNTSGLSINTTANDGIINSLSPGDSATFQATYQITQPDFDAQTAITNVASILATPKRGTFTSPTANASVSLRTASPAVAITKTATPSLSSPPVPGNTIAYAFSVTNSGDVTLTNITLTDPTATVSGGPIATLAPGATDTTTFTASYTLQQTDINNENVTNSATVSGTAPGGATITDVSDDPTNGANVDPNGDGNPDDPTVVAITASPSLSITKVADDDTLRAAGQTITYTYTVTNTGNVPITGVSISDAHNGSGPAPSPAGEAINNDVAPLGDSTDPSGANGSWDTLAPGDSITFTGMYVVTQNDVDTLQ